jgi:hypothetical protein
MFGLFRWIFQRGFKRRVQKKCGGDKSAVRTDDAAAIKTRREEIAELLSLGVEKSFAVRKKKQDYG